MGKKRQAKGQPRDTRKRRQTSKNESSYNSGERVIMRENEAFQEYYKRQGIVKAEEWEDFMFALRDPLPAAFRVTGSKSQAKQMLNLIRDEYFTAISSSSQGNFAVKEEAIGDVPQVAPDKPKTANDQAIESADGEKLKPPRCLSWYPENFAWQLDYSRVSIRRHQHLNKLRGFLLSESESGNISRQETVSMIPPLLMDIKQEHNVLDMCAAPGSKTAQLIECLHADSAKSIPDGMVIANDVDNKRCYMMVHQVKRLQSPNMLIINHDATRLPNMYHTNKETGERERLLFDRILADVPCSGDGTIRKNPDIWRNWGISHATSIHNVQKRVLERGLELLKVRGRLVYSTCSFNPIENEAVISCMLTKCEGSVKLVDCSGELNGLIRAPGLKTWQVMLPKTGEWYHSFEEVPETSRSQIRPTMFPSENIERLGIEHCMRIIPHHQNTGGFFVAVLEKTGPLPWMDSKIVNEATSSDVTVTPKTLHEPITDSATAPMESTLTSTQNTVTSTDLQPEEKVELKTVVDDVEMKSATNGSGDLGQKMKGRGKKKEGYQGFKEDPFYYLEKGVESWPPIKEFYGISEEFDQTWMMVRSKESVKNKTIYLTSSSIKDLVMHNEAHVKFITCGVRILHRNEHDKVDCIYRPVHEGLECMNPYICKRRVMVNRDDAIDLLVNENPLFETLSAEAQRQLADMGVGGVVFVYKHEDRSGLTSEILMSGWRGVASCRLYVPRFERHHFLRLCGIDPDQALVNGEYAVRGKTKDVDNSMNGVTADLTTEATDNQDASVNASGDSLGADKSSLS